MTTHRKNINEFGHAHELTFSCYRGIRFLNNDQICQWLADAINHARVAYEFQLWAYVFMPNHVHLVIYPTKQEYDIAQIRKAIKSPVGKQAIAYLKTNAPEWLPRITRTRSGKSERLFWQSGGGYDRNITEPKTLISMIDYIHANPVRKNLIERPQEWKWSSAASHNNGNQVPLAVDNIPKDWLE